MIAFLHTSKIHIERFEDLVRKFDKDVTTKHFVNEELLEKALINGKPDTSSFKNEIEKIKGYNPDLIICTCSTYGKLSEDNNIERIDKPIIQYIVGNYNRIGLVYTANSTKTISKDLICKLAIEQNREIEVVNCDCSSEWTYFEHKDLIKYEKGIAEKIKHIAPKVDVIFLAQASMEGAKKYLTDIEKDILSSPEFGIKELMKKINSQKRII